MNLKLQLYLERVEKILPGVSESELNALQQELNFTLPEDYVNFMKEFNGGEGEVGENAWLNLFSIAELIETNKTYHLLMDDIPDYYLIGKDAADTGYAIHKSDQTFHAFGLMSDFETDPIIFCGASFEEFIEYLYNQ